MLLYEHDYVTVPNLGAFIANYTPSTINDISGSLMPPLKRIAFNEVLKQDDGLLATYIARREAITLDESKRKIQSFVHDVKDTLAVRHEYIFEKIGSFSINQDKGLIFEPDRRNNFYSESFGFDSLFPKRESIISGNEVYEHSPKVYLEDSFENYLQKSSERKSSLTYALYGLPIMFLMGGLFYVLFSNTPSTKSSLSSVIPLDFLDKTEKVIEKKETKKLAPQPLVVNKADVVKPDFSKKEEVAAITTPENTSSTLPKEEKTITSAKPVVQNTVSSTISINEARYIVVCGMFKNKENVDKLISQLQKNGYSPRVVPSNNLLKVIAADVETLESANKISEKLKELTGERGVIQKK